MFRLICFQFGFSCFTLIFLSRFDKPPIRRKSMIGAVLRDMSMYKIFTLLDTTSRNFRLCDRSVVFCGFLSRQGPVSQQSRNVSGLFRMPQFPLYFRVAGVLIHQTSQSFRNVLRHQLFKTSGLHRSWARQKISRDFRETGPTRLNEPTFDLI